MRHAPILIPWERETQFMWCDTSLLRVVLRQPIPTPPIFYGVKYQIDMRYIEVVVDLYQHASDAIDWSGYVFRTEADEGRCLEALRLAEIAILFISWVLRGTK